MLLCCDVRFNVCDCLFEEMPRFRESGSRTRGQVQILSSAMDFATCPICNFSIPSPELERHVDEHFSDEDYARDFEFAQQIARTPPTLPRIAEDSSECKPSCGDDPQNSSSRCDAKVTATIGNTCDERHASLFRSQSKESFYKVEGGLMTMLRKCLELESGDSTSILSGHVDHFQSTDSWDAGWGCGWRNIQMLSSHLIAQRQEAREVLYGGSGFVPSIGSLQRWLELAWEKGFDTPGADEFDQKIYGKRNWIGTTECAALLRSFGLRARIVDFSSRDFELAASSALHLGLDTRELPQVYGPMDIFLSKGKLDLPPTVSSWNQSYKHFSVSSKDKGHQILTEWVWNYFSGSNVSRSSDRRVVLSEKAPLYFQHDGHSRTIVGIQAKHQKNGKQLYNLLIFDPAEKTRALEKSFRVNVGWQKLIKRGVHTLKKPQYQLCFIEPGIAHGEELEELKALHSTRHEF